MVYGYMRAGKDENGVLDRQYQRLVDYGVQDENIYNEREFNGLTNPCERTQMKLLLEQLSEGDTLVFRDVTRICRNMLFTMEFIEMLRNKGVTVIPLDLTLTEIDINHLLYVFNTIAEWTRDSNGAWRVGE